jgi:hypothetical protein
MARAYPGQGNPFGPLYMLAGLLTVRLLPHVLLGPLSATRFSRRICHPAASAWSAALRCVVHPQAHRGIGS